MNMSFDAHVDGNADVHVGDLPGTDTVYLTVEEDGADFTLYFKDTDGLFYFLHRIREQADKLRRGDIPFNAKRYEVVR